MIGATSNKLKLLKSIAVLSLSLLVISGYAQYKPANDAGQPAPPARRYSNSSTADSLHYWVYGNIFDSTGKVGVQRVQIVVSGSGLPIDADTVSTFTNKAGAYRLWLPDRLRKYSILYISIFPDWGYRSVQAISFRKKALPYKYTAALTSLKREQFEGCGGVAMPQ